MTTFHVKSVERHGKKTWTVVRREEPGAEPVIVGLRCADPTQALADAYRLNVYARERKQACG